jgi:60S ribosome subunit biogenesis protein NIP7
VLISRTSAAVCLSRPQGEPSDRGVGGAEADTLQDRVYYLAERLLRFAAVIGKKELVSVGVCMGKFSKVREAEGEAFMVRTRVSDSCVSEQSKKFKLHITALPVMAPYAKYKVWVKPSSELSWMYGNSLLKV